MKQCKYVLLLLLFFVVNSLYSQQKWSLDRCIRHAMENNLEIKQKTLIAEQDRNTLNRSKYDFLPSVSGSVNHNFN